MFLKSQTNFKHSFEAQAKNVFLIKKTCKTIIVSTNPKISDLKGSYLIYLEGLNATN